MGRLTTERVVQILRRNVDFLLKATGRASEGLSAAGSMANLVWWKAHTARGQGWIEVTRHLRPRGGPLGVSEGKRGGRCHWAEKAGEFTLIKDSEMQT